MSFLFDTSGFTASALTTRANDAEKFPFVESVARSFFSVDTFTGATAQIDRETVGKTRFQKVTRGTTATAQASTRGRVTLPVNSQKIGDKLVITPAEIDGVRMTGLQSGDQVALETLESLIDKGLAEKFWGLDDTLEYLCLKALIEGVFEDLDNAANSVDYLSEFGVSRPSNINLDLTNSAGDDLRVLIGRGIRNVREKLAGLRGRATGFVQLHGSDSWEALQANPQVKDAFERANDGSFLRSSILGGVQFAGAEHVLYEGADMPAAKSILLPVGIPGMYRLDFGSGDKLGFTNQPGQPRFVVPKNQNDPFQDFGEGAEWETSSSPVVSNLWPEAAQEFDMEAVTP